MSVADPERRKVWVAMSDLFLDTDVSRQVDHIARVLAASSFSEAELSRMLRDEVAPICLPNLYDVAGEWAGFPEKRLIGAINSYLDRPALLRRLGRGRRARQLGAMVPEWPRVLERIRATRER